MSRRLALLVIVAAVAPLPALTAEREELVSADVTGQRGGRLVVALRSEPKTLNPVVAIDAASRDVIGRTVASLIAIDRQTQRTVPALAQSWAVSPDGRRYTLKLRRGIRFSDGAPFDADDVVFSFETYLDEKNGSPQRDLLLVGGKPIEVHKVDSWTVTVDLAQPYAAAERLFDGIAVLPRHRLADPQTHGDLAQAWTTATAPAEMAGLGPFRVKGVVPGESVVLERNPYYWKVDRAGTRLPYLDELAFVVVPTEDAQLLRLRTGETDLVSRVSAAGFAALSKESGLHAQDVGPSLEYTFLFFNLNDVDAARLPEVARRQAWFRDLSFRRAVSAAIDRPGIARLAFDGRATPLATHVTPGNRLWLDTGLAPDARSPDRGRALLRAAGYTWSDVGALRDHAGLPVEFSILVSSSNAARLKIATLIQDDLAQLGMKVNVVPLESRSVLDRVLQTYDYEAAVFAMASGDVDPNGEMNVWPSTGKTHLWHLGQTTPGTPWEAEIDALMQKQLTTLRYEERRRLYGRVQRLVAEHLPVIPLVSPNVLVAARNDVANLRPGIIDPYVLWNADELSWRVGTR
jgi:peptide/nickel transport system substrate-binding protein